VCTIHTEEGSTYKVDVATCSGACAQLGGIQMVENAWKVVTDRRMCMKVPNTVGRVTLKYKHGRGELTMAASIKLRPCRMMCL
jgi:hypothetical protein